MNNSDLQSTLDLLRRASKATVTPMRYRFQKEIYPDHLPPAILFPDNNRIKIRSKSTSKLVERKKSHKNELDRQYDVLILKTERYMNKSPSKKEENEEVLDLTKVSPVKLPRIIRKLASRGNVRLTSEKSIRFLEISKIINKSGNSFKSSLTLR